MIGPVKCSLGVLVIEISFFVVYIENLFCFIRSFIELPIQISVYKFSFVQRLFSQCVALYKSEWNFSLKPTALKHTNLIVFSNHLEAATDLCNSCFLNQSKSWKQFIFQKRCRLQTFSFIKNEIDSSDSLKFFFPVMIAQCTDVFLPRGDIFSYIHLESSDTIRRSTFVCLSFRLSVRH